MDRQGKTIDWGGEKRAMKQEFAAYQSPLFLFSVYLVYNLLCFLV